MNLIELIFFVAAIALAGAGAAYGNQWGFFPAAGLAVVGLFTPFLLSQSVIWLDELRFARTRAGKMRSIAEEEFRRTKGKKVLKSWRTRPKTAKDGSVIVTLFFGDTKPPMRAFYRFLPDSSSPVQISDEEASKFIAVYPMR